MTKDKRTDKQFLLDILFAIDSIADFVNGKSYADFEESYLIQSAVIKQLEIIGEAASKLTADTRESEEDTNWNDIIGMRHKMVHGYFDVSIDVVWTTIQNDVPVLKKQIEKALKKL